MKIVSLLILACSIVLGFAAMLYPPKLVLLGLVVLTLSVITLINPRHAMVLLVFSMLLSPEVSLGSAGSGRNIIIRYDDLALAAVALAWLFRAGWIKKEVSLLEITPVHIPIFIYTCIYIISTGLAMMRGELNLLKSMFFTLKYIEYFVLFFMTYNIVQKEEDVRSLLRYGLVTAMLVTVYAYWYHFSTGQQATAPFETPLGEASREGGEPGSLGGYYLVVFGVLMGLIDHGAGQWLKTAISALLVMLPAFLFTLSRASLLGLAGQFSLLLLLGRRKLFVASGGVLLLTLFFSVDALRAPVSQRVAMTTEGARDRQLHEFRMPIVDYTVHLEDSAAQRVQAWQRIITRHLPKHPFLGHGATGIGFEDTQYGLILGEFGLVGLAVFFWMIGKIFQQSLHLYHVGRQPWIRGVGLGVILVLAGLLLQSFTSNTFIIVRIMQPFWFLVGLMCRLHTLSMKTDERA